MRMEDIINDLEEISGELFQKFGTETYDLRCQLYDIRQKLVTLGGYENDKINQAKSDREQYVGRYIGTFKKPCNYAEQLKKFDEIITPTK